MTRDEWSKNHNWCWVCDWDCFRQEQPAKWQLETHEIASGPAAQAALVTPACWFRACNSCHADKLHDHNIIPIAKALAYKKRFDLPNYDRELVNRLLGLAPDAITEDEVDGYLEEMR